MENNEQKMKAQGVAKVYKDILTKAGNNKSVSSTQVGQQMLFNEALRIYPEVLDWIDNKCANMHRTKIKEYFSTKEILVEKITQTLLFLSGQVHYGEDHDKGLRSKSRHKSVAALCKKVMPELEWENTYRFVEIVVEASQYYTKSSKPAHKGEAYNVKMNYESTLSCQILEKLAEKALKAFYPMPTTEKPLDWNINAENKAVGGYDETVGGYKTHQFKLIRQDERLVDYSKISQEVLDSINYIQSTPWIVNKPMLEVVERDLKIPVREDFVKLEYPDHTECQYEIDLKDEEVKKTLDNKFIEELIITRNQYQDQIQLYRAEASDFESELGKYRAIKLALKIANDYKDEEEIYFPHSFDFRGRVYPLPIGLSPQGSDAVKSLLLYKNGEVLNRNGAEWGFAYLASLYGEDKLDFLDRVEMGMSLMEADYKQADEPYQFLAHQLLLKEVVEDPSIEFRGRIHLDACNSGSQFTSAITGDLSGCLATNVIPSFEDNRQVRKDAYLLVAERALELCKKKISKAGDRKTKQMFEFFYELLTTNGRKICKVPVMVSNYGGTMGGRTEILWNMFRELKVDRKWITKKVAAQFSKLIGDSITGTLKGGKAFETYIHKMNNLVAMNNRHVEWTTSDGFRIVHVKNKELKPKQVTVMLPASRKSTVIIKRRWSDSVSVAKMKLAISPNYIHSLDAELLRRVALRMKEEGIVDSDWIHDSFGCHPNYVELMLDITKEEFGDLVMRDPLSVLDSELRSQMIMNDKTIDGLSQCDIPRLNEFEMKDIEKVWTSDWFFS
jgi:DNA-directed RNA polymerase